MPLDYSEFKCCDHCSMCPRGLYQVEHTLGEKDENRMQGKSQKQIQAFMRGSISQGLLIFPCCCQSYQAQTAQSSCDGCSTGKTSYNSGAITSNDCSFRHAVVDAAAGLAIWAALVVSGAFLLFVPAKLLVP